MKERIVVFDMEMLNQSISSVCSIGIVEYVDKKINSTYYSLIKPYNTSFDYHAFSVHHIRPKDLYRKKHFKEVWPEIAHYFNNSIVISHDIQSDLSHLRAVLDESRIPYPDCLLSCTSVMSHILKKDLPKYNLEYMCDLYGFSFSSHHALEDAKATGLLLFKMLEENGLDSVYDFHKKYHIAFGRLKPKYFRSILSPELASKVEEPDQQYFFTHRNILVIGTLKMSKEAFEEKARLTHAFFSKHISSQTNYVLLGKMNRLDYKKLDKVKQLIKQGQDICVITEEEFENHYLDIADDFDRIGFA